MSETTVALNYAEALLELAQQAGDLEGYGRYIDATARAYDSSPAVQSVLASPKVSKALKAKLLGGALVQVGAPAHFVRFLEAVVKRGRAAYLRPIADAYEGLVDTSLNRVRAAITVARTPDPALERDIATALQAMLGKEVIATFAVEPSLLGGAVIRVGDKVFDGSVRRKLVRLRRQLLSR